MNSPAKAFPLLFLAALLFQPAALPAAQSCASRLPAWAAVRAQAAPPIQDRCRAIVESFACDEVAITRALLPADVATLSECGWPTLAAAAGVSRLYGSPSPQTLAGIFERLEGGTADAALATCWQLDALARFAPAELENAVGRFETTWRAEGQTLADGSPAPRYLCPALLPYYWQHDPGEAGRQCSTLQGQNRTVDAIRAWTVRTRDATHSPAEISALVDVARAALLCRKPEEALVALRAAQVDAPDSVALRLLAGHTYLVLNQPEEAAREYRLAVRVARPSEQWRAVDAADWLKRVLPSLYGARAGAAAALDATQAGCFAAALERSQPETRTAGEQDWKALDCSARPTAEKTLLESLYSPTSTGLGDGKPNGGSGSTTSAGGRSAGSP